MKLTIAIYVVIYILSFNKIYANSDIDELKRKSNNYILAFKNEFRSIKKKIISPYNKKQFYYGTYIDSLHFLSEKLDVHRKNIFSDLIVFDLTKKDIQFFENFNRESILLYNIINGFGRIYHSYLNYGNTNGDYSFEQYALDVRSLLVLEQKLLSK